MRYPIATPPGFFQLLRMASLDKQSTAPKVGGGMSLRPWTETLLTSFDGLLFTELSYPAGLFDA